MPLLLLVLIGVPALELILLVVVGQRIGGLALVGVLLFTALVGSSLARWQGRGLMHRLREEAAAGRAPGASLLDGLLITAAGVLLVLPGLLSDLLGLLLLVPPVRHTVRARAVAYLEGKMQQGQPLPAFFTARPQPGGPAAERPRRVFDMPSAGSSVPAPPAGQTGSPLSSS